MKVFRYVTTETQVDISMPSWLFFFFRRLAHITTKRHTPGLKGLDFDLVCIDEACSHNWQRRRDGRVCASCEKIEYGKNP